jgi:hypothetical protein
MGGEDQLTRLREKLKSITWSQGERTNIQQNEGRLSGAVTTCVGTAY